MNAIQLQTSDGTKENAWLCGVCGLIYVETQGYSAGRCCCCQQCGKSTYERGQPRRSMHDECSDAVHSQKDAERLQKAELVKDWDGPVFTADRYFETADEALDWYECEGIEPPEFAYCCTTHYLSLDPESILQNMLSDAGVDEYEYGEVTVMGDKEFAEACTAFNKANGPGKGVQYWHCDESRKTALAEVER